MAATETIPAQRPDSPLFHSLGTPRLIPTSSSSSVFLAGTSPPLSTTPKPPLHISTAAEHKESISNSPPISSPESSPRSSTFDFSRPSSISSTPLSSGLSLDSGTDDDDDLDLPNYGNLQLYNYNDACPPPRTAADESDTDVPEISTNTETTQSDSSLHTPIVADDTMIRQEPSRHVDYLSHDWREEDIWASWRYIVSQRNIYGPTSRLENASWRTWAKSKHRLRTVSPERLNWLKESDVTWLYGPLKPAMSHPITSSTSGPESSSISKSSSFVKKPILKKRSVSEVMLQKSISSSSLIKQAAASVQAQEKQDSRLRMDRVSSDLFSSSTLPSNPPSRDEVDYFSSRTTTSELCTPPEGQTQKHLRFDEKVEQCIAVDCKDSTLDDDDDSDSEPEEDDPPNSALVESDSDDGLFMLDKHNKRPHHPHHSSSYNKKDGPHQKGKISRSNSSSGQMIETLPATTLKSRDSPDIAAETQQQQQQHHVFGKNWGVGTSHPKLSPSPSQETLRPSRPSRNFLLADDDDADDVDPESSSWSFGKSNPKSSLGASACSEPANSRVQQQQFGGPTDGYDGIEGMRRTESGMFMPYDEDEDDVVAESLFGRVSETINTFRDIGHVLWNVGWRK